MNEAWLYPRSRRAHLVATLLIRASELPDDELEAVVRLLDARCRSLDQSTNRIDDASSHRRVDLTKQGK